MTTAVDPYGPPFHKALAEVKRLQWYVDEAYRALFADDASAARTALTAARWGTDAWPTYSNPS